MRCHKLCLTTPIDVNYSGLVKPTKVDLTQSKIPDNVLFHLSEADATEQVLAAGTTLALVGTSKRCA